MKITERDILDRLHVRYDDVSMNARRYVVAEHVPSSTGGAAHIADFVVLDVWRTKLAFHGHEIKCSRSDWLAELRQPWKAEAIKRHMDHWWLVVSELSIVKMEEIPEDWGLMFVAGSTVRAKKIAPRLTAPWAYPSPAVDRAFTAAFTRAAQKTAMRQARVLVDTPLEQVGA